MIKTREAEAVKMKEMMEEKEKLESLNRSNGDVINWLNKQLQSFKSVDANLGSVIKIKYFQFIYI